MFLVISSADAHSLVMGKYQPSLYWYLINQLLLAIPPATPLQHKVAGFVISQLYQEIKTVG